VGEVVAAVRGFHDAVECEVFGDDQFAREGASLTRVRLMDGWLTKRPTPPAEDARSTSTAW
jgi:hypothetical protein